MFLFMLVAAFFIGLVAYNHFRFWQAEKEFPPKGRFVTVDGVQFHYLQKGTGQPVVFLHGGILTANDFELVMNQIAKLGYQAIALDRPGYGYSGRPYLKMTPTEQAKWIHRVLKKLGIQKPILVGHSWSGLLVLSYARIYPDDLSGIVLLGGAMYLEGYPAANGDPISKLVTTPIIGDLFVHTILRSPLGPMITKNMLKETFAPDSVPTDYEKATLSLWLRPKHFTSNRFDVLAFVPTAKQMSKEYKKIRHPMIIAVGEKDPFGTIEQAKRLKQDVPHAKLVILPEIGHMIPQKHPQIVVEMIQRLSNRSA